MVCVGRIHGSVVTCAKGHNNKTIDYTYFLSTNIYIYAGRRLTWYGYPEVNSGEMVLQDSGSTDQ